MNKIVVLDLDGTLLKNDKTVSNETIDTLLDFKKQNNKILFASARPPRDAYKYIPDILKDNPIICYNGACIINSDKKILYKKEISREDTLKILKVTKKYNYNNICFEIDDTLYSNFDVSDFFKGVSNNIVDIEKMEFESVYKIIICNKISISQNFQKEISEIANGIITDNGTLCQIMNKDVSKWTSIQALMKNENVKKDDVIAFGDDYNDYEMIRSAGIGVAMENAEKAIKQVADYITDSNMNDGVANFIKKYCK